jgi:hypothetical protein
MMRPLLAIALLAGCSGPPCGPGAEVGSEITVTAGGVTLEFGNFTSSANNDCSVAGSPTSLTIDGVQTSPDQPGFFLTLCLPRPDQIDDQSAPLVPGQIPPGADDLVQVINVNGDLGGGCTLALDSSGVFAAAAHFGGYCGDGLDPAGYAMELTGALPGTRTCAGVGETVSIELGGVAAVTAVE